MIGYSCFNEGSARDWQYHTAQVVPGKNFQSTGGFGPWMVTADRDPDPQVLDISTVLNGENAAKREPKDMIFDVKTIISYVSHISELQPGDVIASGTPSGRSAVARAAGVHATGRFLRDPHRARGRAGQSNRRGLRVATSFAIGDIRLDRIDEMSGPAIDARYLLPELPKTPSNAISTGWPPPSLRRRRRTWCSACTAGSSAPAAIPS